MGIDTLQDWRDALVWAQRAHQADDPFWATDHVLASRAMPVGDSGVSYSSHRTSFGLARQCARSTRHLALESFALPSMEL